MTKQHAAGQHHQRHNIIIDLPRMLRMLMCFGTLLLTLHRCCILVDSQLTSPRVRSFFFDVINLHQAEDQSLVELALVLISSPGFFT